MPSYVTPKKNTAFIFYIGLTQQADTRLLKANPTLAAGDFQVSIDGGALNNLGTLPTVTPAAGRMVKVSLSAAEMNGDNLTVVCSDAAGAEWCDQIINIQTSARQIDDLAFPNTTGRGMNVSAGGVTDADMTAISTDSTAADNLETMLDGTGGQTLSLGRLAVSAAAGVIAIEVTGGAASGATPAGAALKATGGAASTTGGGVSAVALAAIGGAGAASTNGAAAGASFTGGGTNTVSSFADGVQFTATSVGRGIIASGLGNGAGVQVVAGATGIGLSIAGGATSGNGASIFAGADGHGMAITGLGSFRSGLSLVGTPTGSGLLSQGQYGIFANSNTTAGAGIFATANSGTSNGIEATGIGSGVGLKATGGSTGIGFSAVGGATSGVGLSATSTSGNAITATAGGGNGHGLALAGNGSGDGLKATPGATGHGIEAIGGATSGNGIKASGTAGNSVALNLLGQGSAAGLLTTGGATGIGFSAVGGATSGAGASFIGSAGNSTGLIATGVGNNSGIVATKGGTGTYDITGSLSETPVIADAVWDELIAGHLGAGSTGAALNAASSADPWNTSLPGAYAAGKAGFIVGTNLDDTITSRLAPTVAARKLDVNAAGEAGLDWANIGGQATAVNLSSTNIDPDQVVASVTGAVGSVTGNVGGNVVGNVNGNVVGSVASVTAPVTVGTNNDKTGYSIGVGGISNTAFAAGAIDAAALAASAGNEIADAVLLRDLATGSSASSRNVRNALRTLRNRVAIAVGGGTDVYEEDDTTIAWSAVATRDASADNITEIVPV